MFEHAGIHQLIFRRVLVTATVLLHELPVGKCLLWIFVEILHVGMGGRRIEIKIVFLDVLTVIPFYTAQAEGALFQDGIAAVPEGHRKADHLVAVANAGKAVFIPAIRLRARLAMGKILPGGAMRTVVLTHGPPGPLAQVRAPALPMFLAPGILFKTQSFRISPLLLCLRRPLRLSRHCLPHFASMTSSRRRSSPTDQA